MLVLLALVFSIGLAVGSEPGAGKKIGVMWMTKSGMADRVARGFMGRIKELAPGVELEFEMALPDPVSTKRVYRRFQDEKDALIFLRSHGAEWLAANPPRIPSFIGAASNPERLGLMPDMSRPDGLATGVTYYLPVARQFELYRQLFPELKSVGLLIMTGHPSSAIEDSETRAACEQFGIEYRVASCGDKPGLVTAVKQLRDQVDLFILGNQNLLIDNSAVVATIAGMTPVMSYSQKPIGKGALGGLVPDDAKLGALLAESVIDVLLGGKSVAEVPVKSDSSPRFLIDSRRLSQLGLTLPESLQEIASEI
jgi:putative tryptophan/tyrosine transport system substrate-binding protein